ncbi:MAG TPA: M20/M25/M40 family metallo-hydrolase [Clostridiaceae bacterium]|nr:M20/M25/M40 family metallo-hydrolase [Clostridiaceae bacterium]
MKNKYIFTDNYKQQLLDLICDLVRIPTVNFPPDGNEKPGQEYLKKYLENMQFIIDEFSPKDLPEYNHNPEFLHRNFEGRNNIVAVWKGTGGGKSLLLTGHMDVVPIEPLPWTITQPFEPLIKDGRLYGRGCADMKGGLALAVVVLKMLKENGFVPKGDIIFESVVDEEYAGANGTIASRLKGYNADYAVLLEFSGLKINPACVGGIIFKITLEGEAGMPYTGVKIKNPAYGIAEVINLIGEYAEKRIKETPVPELWKNVDQKIQTIITKVKAGEAYESGQLSVPINAWIEVILQSYPGETAESLEAGFKEFLYSRFSEPKALSVELEYHYCRPGYSDPNHPGTQLLAECARRYTDKAVICGGLASCDLFAITEIGGMNAAIFGPIGGNVHAPDEWLDIESLGICAQSLADFIVEWCG